MAGKWLGVPSCTAFLLLPWSGTSDRLVIALLGTLFWWWTWARSAFFDEDKNNRVGCFEQVAGCSTDARGADYTLEEDMLAQGNIRMMKRLHRRIQLLISLQTAFEDVQLMRFEH